MCSLFREVVILLIATGVAGGAQRVLKVCSDPNNLPFSNRAGEGFENRIAELIARDLNARVEYTWFAQRRGFVRNTLRAGLCDVILGVPARFDPVETTRPYYRSTYVFVTRTDRDLRLASLDDPRLKKLRIGVHVVGDDYANPPPVHALGKRKIIHNVSGYTVYGDYSRPNPPARLIEAVASDEIDVAIVWGPFGGYFGGQQSPALRITPIVPDNDGPGIPFVFDIALGVRKGDDALRSQLQGVLDHRRREIDAILRQFGVPLKVMK